jgi:hypothetical protein
LEARRKSRGYATIGLALVFTYAAATARSLPQPGRPERALRQQENRQVQRNDEHQTDHFEYFALHLISFISLVS